MSEQPKTDVKHTPGPWAVRGDSIVRSDECAETNKNEYGYQSGHYVARLVTPVGGSAVLKANGALIAAAPETAAQRDELLAAGRALVQLYDNHRSEWLALRAAIAKAQEPGR